MRVLGIDPGYDRLGVAVLEKTGGAESLLFSDCLGSEMTNSVPDRLYELGTTLTRCIEEYKPNCVAVESLYFNKNQKTAMAVAEARGMIIYLAKTHGCEVFEYTPQQIKVAVTGYGKSDKEQVAHMVRTLLPKTRSDALDDEYDAIAVAITCLASERIST